MPPYTQAPVLVGSSAWVPIYATRYAREIRIQETNQAGTVDYLIAAPLSTDGPVSVPAGTMYPIPTGTQACFNNGLPVCYLKTAGASVYFDVIELGP